jgi:hypothetical protein
VIRVDEEARMITEALGTRGCLIGDVLYIHPEVLPGTLEGRKLLIAEMTCFARGADEAVWPLAASA